MIPNDYQRIFRALYRKTTDKIVEWTSGAHDQQFIASFGSISIVLTRMDEYRDRWYDFSIIDEGGTEIDQFVVGPDDEGYREAAETWEAARRIAGRIDETISELERKLGITASEPDIPPPPPGPPSDDDDDNLPF